MKILEMVMILDLNLKNRGALNTTELLSQDGTITVGTPLPAGRYGHCMVTLPDGKVMILGGESPNGPRVPISQDNKGRLVPYSLQAYAMFGVCIIYYFVIVLFRITHHRRFCNNPANVPTKIAEVRLLNFAVIC